MSFSLNAINLALKQLKHPSNYSFAIKIPKTLIREIYILPAVRAELYPLTTWHTGEDLIKPQEATKLM